MNEQSENIKVLLVDDNPEDARLIEALLADGKSDVSFDLECADRLPSGLERLHEGGIDIILLDLPVPDVHGLGTLARLHAQIPEVPIVVLGGLNGGPPAAQVLQKGAQDYLIKGQVDSNLLVWSLRHAIEQQRMLAELEQRTQESQASLYALDKIIRENPDGIIIVDKAGVVRFVNAAAESLLGRKSEELTGEMFGFPIVAGEKTEVEIIRKGGKTATVEMHVVEIEWEGETAYLASLRDITERKEMEQQLVVADRLASIGELVAGIAHEINNPLTSVVGFSELVLNRNIPTDVRKNLEIVYSEAQRAAGIVKNLLTFARKHAVGKQLVNISSIIEKVLELRAYEQKVNNIELNTRFAPGLPEVMVDYFQLQQVFTNIIINAEYFMAEAHHRGTLTITTERLDHTVRVSFTDDGPGIGKENLGHLFDPFFTTKEIGKGTGLGLSICHGIITEHGGRIYAESELGKGATFIVELPITQ